MPAPWLSGSTYIFEISTAGRSDDGALNFVVVGYSANQHGVADHSAVLTGGQQHPVGIGKVLGEACLRQVLVDERRHILLRHRRRTRQWKRLGGDVGEFGKLRGGRDCDSESHTFHCARWNPVFLSTSTTLDTRSR